MLQNYTILLLSFEYYNILQYALLAMHTTLVLQYVVLEKNCTREYVL